MKWNLEKKVENDQSDRFKSEGERRIAELLDSYGIRYNYEQGVLVEDKGKPKIWHPDFHLKEFSVHIEYYGLAGNREYDQGIKRKTTVYKKMGMAVIPVFPWTFCDDWQSHIMDSLQGILNRRLNTFSERRYKRTKPMLTYQSGGHRGKYGSASGRGYR